MRFHRRGISLALTGLVGALVFVGASSAASTGLAGNHNWADRLGYGKQNRILILHADDAGMFAGANSGIQSLFVDGEIQSASAMPPLPYFTAMAEWYRLNPTRDVGVHLTLNSEWKTYRWGPVFDPARGVKRILEHRFLFWGWKPYFPGQFFYSWLYRGPNTITKELRAQVDLALAAMSPARPTHLDSHMGALFARKSHFKRYLAVAKEKGIPAVTVEKSAFTEECFRGVPQGELLSRVSGWMTARIERGQEEMDTPADPWPFPRLDQYCPIPYGSGLGQTRDRLKSFIEDELPHGITQILYHPSDPDPLLSLALAPDTANRRVNVDRKLYDKMDPSNVLLLVFNAPNVHFTTWRNMTSRFGLGVPCVDPADGVIWVKPSSCP